jgi:hypothetical protein
LSSERALEGGKDQFTAWPERRCDGAMGRRDVTTQDADAIRQGDEAPPLPLEGKFFASR